MELTHAFSAPPSPNLTKMTVKELFKNTRTSSNELERREQQHNLGSQKTGEVMTVLRKEKSKLAVGTAENQLKFTIKFPVLAQTSVISSTWGLWKRGRRRT